MTQKDKIINSRYPFYNPSIPYKDIELNSEQVKELMDDYWIDQLRGLMEELCQIHPEYIIDRIKDEISSAEQGI